MQVGLGGADEWKELIKVCPHRWLWERMGEGEGQPPVIMGEDEGIEDF